MIYTGNDRALRGGARASNPWPARVAGHRPDCAVVAVQRDQRAGVEDECGHPSTRERAAASSSSLKAPWSRSHAATTSRRPRVASPDSIETESTASGWRSTMISRSFTRPERTAKRAFAARNRYRMRYTGLQHRPASSQVNAHGRVIGTHTVRRRRGVRRRSVSIVLAVSRRLRRGQSASVRR